MIIFFFKLSMQNTLNELNSFFEQRWHPVQHITNWCIIKFYNFRSPGAHHLFWYTHGPLHSCAPPASSIELSNDVFMLKRENFENKLYLIFFNWKSSYIMKNKFLNLLPKTRLRFRLLEYFHLHWLTDDIVFYDYIILTPRIWKYIKIYILKKN